MDPNRGLARAGHDHSTLEVVPAPDYDKEAIQPPVLAPKDQIYHAPLEIPVPESGGLSWGGGADGAHEAKPRILGLKRRTFFILAWVISLVVAIAIGVGAGLGATMNSRNSGTGTAGAEEAVKGSISSAITSAPTPGTNAPTPTPDVGVLTSTPTQSPPSTAPPTQTSPTRLSASSSSPPKSTTSVKVGGVGGRCTNQWGGDCICLDQGVCKNKWKGTPYTGTVDNWPCPNDPDNIMACIVKPCLGKVEPAQCLWKEACRELNPGTDSAPICPGDGDFVCCAHSW